MNRFTLILIWYLTVIYCNNVMAKNKSSMEDLEKSSSDIVGAQKHSANNHPARLSSTYGSSYPSYYGYQSAYPTNSPAPYRSTYLYNPIYSDPYERIGREYASASSNIGYAASAPDLMASAGGHSGGGGGGGGHGHHGWHKGSGIGNTGFGLLGLMGLLSLLQGVLNALSMSQQTTTAAAAAGGGGGTGFRNTHKRKIREIIFSGRSSDQNETMSDRITRLILPSLTVIAHARDGYIPVNCTYHEICKTNSILQSELGEANANLVGNKLRDAIHNLLNQVDRTRDNEIFIKSATKSGQVGLSCQKIHPACSQLRNEAKERRT